jgi:hypothetical protein
MSKAYYVTEKGEHWGLLIHAPNRNMAKSIAHKIWPDPWSDWDLYVHLRAYRAKQFDGIEFTSENVQGYLYDIETGGPLADFVNDCPCEICTGKKGG